MAECVRTAPPGPRYTFLKEPDPGNPYDHTRVEISLNTEGREDVIDAFEEFLRACGFVLDHRLVEAEAE